jgi:hypothetical protein
MSQNLESGSSDSVLPWQNVAQSGAEVDAVGGIGSTNDSAHLVDRAQQQDTRSEGELMKDSTVNSKTVFAHPEMVNSEG